MPPRDMKNAPVLQANSFMVICQRDLISGDNRETESSCQEQRLKQFYIAEKINSISKTKTNRFVKNKGYAEYGSRARIINLRPEVNSKDVIRRESKDMNRPDDRDIKIHDGKVTKDINSHDTMNMNSICSSRDVNISDNKSVKRRDDIKLNCGNDKNMNSHYGSYAITHNERNSNSHEHYNVKSTDNQGVKSRKELNVNCRDSKIVNSHNGRDVTIHDGKDLKNCENKDVNGRESKDINKVNSDDSSDVNKRNSSDTTHANSSDSTDMQSIEEKKEVWKHIAEQSIETHIHIHNVTERLHTFFGNNWISKCSAWWPKELSEAGFYYRGIGLEVHCFSCKLHTDVLDWYIEPKESPAQAHARLRPTCEYVVALFMTPKSNLPENKKTLNDIMSMKNGTAKFSTHNSSAVKDDVQMDSRNTTDSNNHVTLKKDTSHISGLQIHISEMSIRQNKTDRSTNATATNENGKIPIVTSQNMSIHTDVNGFQTTFDNTTNNQASLMNESIKSQITYDGTFGLHHPEFKYPQYKSKSARLKTFVNWKFEQTQKADTLADTGYFYTGKKDIVRCFCCDLGLAEWDAKDDPWIEHARHNAACWYLKTQKGHSYIESVKRDWKRIYNPKHAAFDDKMSRIATFDGWRSDIEQTPEILAEAGFFFTGEEDVVRCHYCDGGLRHWESGDIPWEEHAKWFPFCKFVIKMKGREFIEEMKKKREAMERGHSLENGSSTDLTETVSNLDVLQKLRGMQFENSQITYADAEYYKRHGNRNYRVEELVELILENTSSSGDSRNYLKDSNSDLEESSHGRDPKTLLETNRKLKEKLKCIRCRTNDTCILFVNCGHRATCESCAERMDFCPICDKRIKTRLKTFLS